jgi:hypothetical protein
MGGWGTHMMGDQATGNGDIKRSHLNANVWRADGPVLAHVAGRACVTSACTSSGPEGAPRRRPTPPHHNNSTGQRASKARCTFFTSG